MHPKYLSISDFTYTLPPERIANYPLPQRDQSKLLVWQNGNIMDDVYAHIDEYLPENSLLIFNDTKVVAARLLFQKNTGAQIELFCLEPSPVYADIPTAMAQTNTVQWLCLIGGASKWKTGQVLEKKITAGEEEIILQASYTTKERDSFLITFSWTPGHLTFAEILHAAGVMPLPPYIKRNAEVSDTERYQTIYAQQEGSVAAPTAGLHFTSAIFEKLDARHIERGFVTLHVGAGTFMPVKSEKMQDHTMHTEFIDVSISTLQRVLNFLDKHITVVGTTSLRTIESLYLLGIKTILFPEKNLDELTVDQWDGFDITSGITANNALESLVHKMQLENKQRLVTKTSLLIAPEFTFKIANALVTNFHQPKSTLLLLVAAFAGKDWKKIYDHALQKEYRFLSYGDGCLLFRG